jgi:hypothetical protein
MYLNGTSPKDALKQAAKSADEALKSYNDRL